MVKRWRWERVLGRGMGAGAPARDTHAAPAVPALAVYPPVDPGLPVLPPEVLLHAAQPRLARLRELVASEPGGFGPAWLAPVEALAREVHLLPASADAHYAAPAGLFHAALDVAFHALQAAGGRIFTAEGAQRHALEPRWRYAVFLAALAWPAQRALAQLAVSDDRGREWAPLAGPLWPWLHAGGAGRYFPCWLEANTGAGQAAPGMVERTAPRERLEWLAQGDVRILQELQQAASGIAPQGGVARFVAQVGERVLRVDAARQRSRYGRLTVGCHLEPYLLDAMRAAFESGTWRLNVQGSPLWWATDGVFLEWTAAHPDVLRAFDDRGWTGLPRSPWTLADALGRAGAIAAAADGRWVHAVALPDAQGPRAAWALRFIEPACMLGLHPGPALPDALLAGASQGAAAAAPAHAGAIRLPTPVQDLSTSLPDLSTPVPDLSPPVPHLSTPVPDLPTPVPDLPTSVPDRLLTNPPQAAAAPATLPAAAIRVPAARWLQPAPLRDAVRQLAQHHRASPGEAAQCFPWGIALRIDWIVQHSPVPLAQWVRALESNDWLGRPPGCRNPAARVHEVPFDSGRARALVLNAAGAQALGLAEAAAP